MVLIAMRAAGNPQNWRWLTEAGKPRVAPPLELTEIDPVSGTPRDRGAAAAEPAAREALPALETGPTLRPAQPLPTLTAEFWQRFVHQLDRASQTHLYQLAFPVPAAATPVAPESAQNLAERLRAFYQQYTAELLAQASQLGTADSATRNSGYDLVFDWQQLWREQVEPILNAWADPAAPAAELTPLQTALDGAAAAFVADQTAIPAATDHLFVQRLVRDCRQLSADQLAAAPNTALLQLLNQPRAYRGQAVAIEGRIRAARRIPSTRNGPTATFYEWWVQPADGTTIPFCVLTTAWPPGLPEPSDSLTTFNLPARFVGFFYKVRSYLASGGRVQFCPTLLATAPQYTLPQPAAPPPAWWWLPLLALCGAAMAVAAAVAVYRMTLVSRPPRRSQPAFPEHWTATDQTVSSAGEQTTRLELPATANATLPSSPQRPE